MKNNVVGKGLVLGIIVLFVGASVVPSTGMVEKSTIGRSIFVHVDLIIEKSDDPDPVYAGGYLTYTLSVTHGPPNNWPASNVTVTDILPSGVTFNYANPAPTGSSDSTYWWFFSTLDVGGSETIIINVTVDSGTTGTVTNIANVTTDTEEWVLENNEDNEETNIFFPPIAVNDTATTPEDTPVAINVTANDYDPDGAIDPTTVNIVTNVSHGSTSVNPTNGMVTYTPNLDYYGPDSFYYTVKDNLGWTSNVAKVSITVVGNYPPNKPDRPSGPTRGKAGVEYTYCIINATDPDGDDIWANFSWGDGSYSGWIGPYASGEDICASHTWERGNYEIKAKLKDEEGLESPWSDPLPITMPKNKPFNFNFPMLSWFLERFPNAFPMLRYMLGL